MYLFTSIEPAKELEAVKELEHSGKISQLKLFPEYNEVKVYGILRNLFGEPLYETEDYENAYEYVIRATDEFRNITLYFSVFQGPSGCAIGAGERTMDMIQAVTEFMQLLKSIKPIDYMYEGTYMDAFVRIKFGIQNGQVIYEECDLEEEDDGNEEVTE